MGQYLDLRGALDQRLVRIALNTVVADLDALSMRVRSDADGPYGVIVRPRPTDDVVQVVDLRPLDPEAALSEAMASMDRAMETPRDLQGDDLFGAVLFQITDTRSLLFQRVHHLLLDGYSAVIALQVHGRGVHASFSTRTVEPGPRRRCRAPRTPRRPAAVGASRVGRPPS
ncbi:condensation domain-containing protein [Curtobacterium flaccumfaciens]|nr:condensation domain-containing protein [Curtobacterium flaccumfaciens]